MSILRNQDRRFVWILGIVCLSATNTFADDWPHWMGPQHDGVWREDGILKSFPEGGPKVKWRAPVKAGYSGPTVADNHVFMIERLVDGKPEGERIPTVPGRERVFCLDANDGSLVWEHTYQCDYAISYPEGPRTSPVFEAGRLYTLGAMGHLICFNAENGEIVWQSQLAERFEADVPVWGFSATPRIDGDRLLCVCGGEDNAIIALNKLTGDKIWGSLTAEEVGYAPPVFHGLGENRQLIFWHDVAINGLDPQSGEVLWTLKTPDTESIQRPSVTIVTPRVHEDLVYVSEFYNGSTVIRLKPNRSGAEIVWRDKPNGLPYRDNLNILMTTPVINQGHVISLSGDGEIRCLKLADGELVWRERKPVSERPAYFATWFLVEHADRYFAFTDQGELIICQLTPTGYTEIDRTLLLKPTGFARGRDIVWSHPAFAYQSIFARNDEELICIDLSEN